MTKMRELEGKKAIIIGASGGIGYACAERFLEEGAVVCGTYRSNCIQGFEEKYAERFSSVRLDLSEKESISKIIRQTVRSMGGVDILVNAAGTACPELTYAVRSDNWERIISENLTGAFLTMQSVIVPMISAKGGAVINISSVFGIRGGAGQAGYCASKAGMLGMTKAAAVELASKNIRVNAVAPGYIETAMTADFDDEHRQKCIESIPMKRFGKPEEVADLCVFLAGDRSKYITGQTFVIDGGLSV